MLLKFMTTLPSPSIPSEISMVESSAFHTKGNLLLVTSNAPANIRNYQSLIQNSKWEILKSPDGTAKYNYKDKHGIICFTSIDDTPLFLLDGKVIEIPADFINKNKEHLDEDALGQLLHISKEDIASVTVIKDGRATVIFGEKAKNGVISIETKAFQELPSDTCTIEI